MNAWINIYIYIYKEMVKNTFFEGKESMHTKIVAIYIQWNSPLAGLKQNPCTVYNSSFEGVDIYTSYKKL